MAVIDPFHSWSFWGSVNHGNPLLPSSIGLMLVSNSYLCVYMIYLMMCCVVRPYLSILSFSEKTEPVGKGHKKDIRGICFGRSWDFRRFKAQVGPCSQTPWCQFQCRFAWAGLKFYPPNHVAKLKDWYGLRFWKRNIFMIDDDWLIVCGILR